MKYFVYIFFTVWSMVAAKVFPPASSDVQPHMFAVQSIDTMKYSRDLALQELHDPSFDATINEEMGDIKDAGANYVAIDTPYDAQFSPMLARWVNAARSHGLSIWFRGNFSGWEGWFNYATITPADHEMMLNQFISANSNLFQNGDIFTPCPECENGGPGDPRQTGNPTAYRDFLIREYNAAGNDFKKIGKKVTIYNSMNADVAAFTIDPHTAAALGGTILIDHYVSSAHEFGSTIMSLGSTSKSLVGIGEFGAPIPDLNGPMTEVEQADFVDSLLRQAYLQTTRIPSMNYWVLQGGSTALVNDDGTTREAYGTVKKYYTAPYVAGVVKNNLGIPLANIPIVVDNIPYVPTNDSGQYQIFLPDSTTTVVIGGNGFISTTTVFAKPSAPIQASIILSPLRPTALYKFLVWLHNIFNHF